MLKQNIRNIVGKINCDTAFGGGTKAYVTNVVTNVVRTNVVK